MSFEFQSAQLGQVVTAIGGLGTAAFGLVDAAKAVFGGINRIGLKHIQQVVSNLTPDQTGADASGKALPARPVNALPRQNILETVEANWVNGTDLASQKAIAKSLIKLHLSAGNAAALAAKANVDPVVLGAVAAKTLAGTPMAQPESDVFSRFDLIVTAMLDEAYQLSDQVYRNGTRGWLRFSRCCWPWPADGAWRARASGGRERSVWRCWSGCSPLRWRRSPRTFRVPWQRL
jgi:hypothetical protein